jgi:hypothetical protein
MQRDLGSLGVMSRYKPPGANYFLNNYQIVINMLPELRQTLSDPLLSSISRLAPEYAQTLEEVLIRHLGVLEERAESLQKKLRNPVTDFREGVQLILFVPFYLISWLGILSTNKLRALSRKPIPKILSGVVALVGFLSAVVGLVIGWSDFVKIISRLLGIQ